MDAIQQLTPGLEIAHIIQLAIAPVFLLAAIAGFLSVMSTRLGRVIDRARVVELRVPLAVDKERKKLLCDEIEMQWRRIRVINWAIRLCVSGALMVCLVIVTLFVGQFVTSNISTLVAGLFVLAMLSVIGGLICFLLEIAIATKRMRQGMEVSLHGVEGHAPE